ncbi:MAG TPA: hypothetical protein VGE34_00275 [Candidatus Saccharimonadales bacterium]
MSENEPILSSSTSSEVLQRLEVEFTNHGAHTLSAQPEVITPEIMDRQIAAMHEQTEALRPQREAEEEARKLAAERWQRTQKIETWRRRMKGTLAAVVLFSTVKSGGLFDMAADPFVDAGDVVASAVEPSKAEDFLWDEMDGIRFKDLLPSEQVEERTEAEEQADRKNDARDKVIELFSLLDRDSTVVKNAANKWRYDHQELFVDENRIDTAKRRIDESNSNQEVITALEDFMSFYDIRVGFEGAGDDQPEPFDSHKGEVKQLARAMVGVFSKLPKDLVRMSEVEQIEIASELSADNIGFGSDPAGLYSEDYNRLSFRPVSKWFRHAAKFDEIFTGGEQSYQGAVAHEFGHALAGKLEISSPLDEGGTIDAEDGLGKPYLTQIAGNVIKRPKYVSIYGRSGYGEYTAEAFSGLFSDISNDLALPEETRRFGSEANAGMLRILAELEERYPGAALLIVGNKLQ